MTEHARQLRVLCLEDSPLDAELVLETLAGAGYQLDVALAPDRRRFAELLGAGPYDVILADFALPGFDAHGALELAKAAQPDTPFICVSGTIGEEATVELLKQGADDCVLKDRLRRLPFAVQRALEEAARRRELAKAEASLRESRERERFALQGTNDGLWDVRMDTGATYLSPRGREILGFRPDEMAKVAEAWDQMVCPDDLPATQAALDAYLEGDASIFDVEQRLLYGHRRVEVDPGARYRGRSRRERRSHAHGRHAHGHQRNEAGAGGSASECREAAAHRRGHHRGHGRHRHRARSVHRRSREARHRAGRGSRGGDGLRRGDG